MALHVHPVACFGYRVVDDEDDGKADLGPVGCIGCADMVVEAASGLVSQVAGAGFDLDFDDEAGHHAVAGEFKLSIKPVVIVWGWPPDGSEVMGHLLDENQSERLVG